MEGSGVMTLSQAGKPHLTTEIYGTFTLRMDPPLQPSGEIELEQ